MTSFFTLMAQLFEVLNTLPRRDFGTGETIIAEDSTTGMLFLLIDGEVEVYKDDVPLAATSEPGSVVTVALGSETSSPSTKRPSPRDFLSHLANHSPAELRASAS